MSLLYDASQEAIASQAQRILAARTSKDRLLGLLETTGEFDRGYWATCVEQGWTGVTIPAEFGGLDLGLVEMGLIAEAAGMACVGAPSSTPRSRSAMALAGWARPS